MPNTKSLWSNRVMAQHTYRPDCELVRGSRAGIFFFFYFCFIECQHHIQELVFFQSTKYREM